MSRNLVLGSLFTRDSERCQCTRVALALIWALLSLQHIKSIQALEQLALANLSATGCHDIQLLHESPLQPTSAAGTAHATRTRNILFQIRRSGSSKTALGRLIIAWQEEDCHMGNTHASTNCLIHLRHISCDGTAAQGKLVGMHDPAATSFTTPSCHL